MQAFTVCGSRLTESQQMRNRDSCISYTNDKSKILPRPISLCEIDKENGRFHLVYRVTGQGTGTDEFSQMKAGDTIPVLGPLGNGFPVEKAEGKKVFLMGGGIGVPPILELAKQMKM